MSSGALCAHRMERRLAYVSQLTRGDTTTIVRLREIGSTGLIELGLPLHTFLDEWRVLPHQPLLDALFGPAT